MPTSSLPGIASVLCHGENNTRIKNVILITIAMLCLCKQIKTNVQI